MATNSPKHVNPKDVARLLGISPTQVKARVRASAQATARTSSRTSILMLNEDILGKVMGKYSELVNRPDITTQEERLRMLEYIVGKLESRLNSKQKFLDDISKDIDTELISTYLKEANDILANIRESIRIIKAKQKRGTKILGLVKNQKIWILLKKRKKK
jgi:flagellar motility protein MotE (MotC chaperone)